MSTREGGAVGLLVRARSSLTLPILERRVEDLLGSTSPGDYFADKSVDPKRFVTLAASSIAYAANEEALRQLSRLMRLDERRFAPFVEQTLLNAQDAWNPYTLAYRGLEIGDPAVDREIAAWAEKRLSEEMQRFSNPTYERVRRERRVRAEALVERYGGPTTEDQWKADPLVARLKPELAAALRESMSRYAREVVQGRAPK
jgi:hypothetical protein